MSLRRRLVIVVLGVVAVALGLTSLAIYNRLDEYLLHQADVSLDRATAGAARRLATATDPRVPRNDEPGRGPVPAPRGLGPNTFYVQLRDASGNVLEFAQREVGEVAESPPVLPNDVDTGTRQRYTVDSEDGSLSYRLRVVRVPGVGTMVVATSLADADSTLRHVLFVEIIGGIAVLLTLAVVSRILVGVGLRPIDAMERATARIADGDFSHRVEVANPGTEIGRLGTSFNGMTEKLDASFAAQRATEERLRRFVADASHELRTPLTSIRGYAELHRAGALREEPDMAKAMGRIEQEAVRMGLLVNDLLLLARLDEGRRPEQLPVDLTRVLSDLVADARAVEPGRAFAVRMPDDPVVVIGDRAQLEQVVANLLGNVRDHAGETASVEVGLSVDEPARRVVVRVHDDGVGIAADLVGRVFDRFVRADEARTRAAGHVGLGLSIAAAIVASHGGSIAAASAPGEGTTITVELPLATPASPG